MQYLGHAGVLGNTPAPLDCLRTVLTGTQTSMEALFARRYAALRKAGAFKEENRAERLVDRRPVLMVPSTTNYAPPKKAVVQLDARPAYDHLGLTKTQRGCRTDVTLGKPMNMENRVATQRFARVIARQAHNWRKPDATLA